MILVNGHNHVAVALPITVKSFQIDGNADDGYEKVSDGEMNRFDTSLQMCYEGEQIIIGMYFKDSNFLVPRGIDVPDAYVQFTAAGNDSGAVTYLIKGQKSTSPAALLGNDFDISSRELTDTEVSWTPAAWIADERGVDQRTANIGPIIKEIIDGSGYVMGDAFVIVISTAAENPNYRSAYFGTDSPADAPEIVVSCQGHVGGTASDAGLKAWEWKDYTLVEVDQDGNPFSGNQLYIDSKEKIDQVSIVGNRLRFYVEPKATKGSWANALYNYRAELREAPWNIEHPLGTKVWYSFKYYFGDTYIPDDNCQWGLFQVHNGVTDADPLIALQIMKDNQISGNTAGELFVVNSANTNEYTPTGIIPQAGTVLRVVIQAVFDDNDVTGFFEVKIDGVIVYSANKRTTLIGSDFGGNFKVGIYKWPWADSTPNVDLSEAQGITYLETFIGLLKIITRYLGDPDYDVDEYNNIKP